MAEAFPLAAGAVGIIAAGLHATRLLLDDIQNIKGAPEALQRLKDDLSSFSLALDSLRGVQGKEWEALGETIAEEAQTTIKICTTALEKFRSKLHRWTKHSEDGSLNFWNRAKVGVFKQSAIAAASTHVQNCKMSVDNFVNIATLYSSIRHTHMTEELRKTMSTKQSEIQTAIGATDHQLVELRNRMQDLRVTADNSDEVNDDELSHAEALGQLEEERKAINASHKLLNELLAKSQEEVVGKAAAESHNTATFGDNNAGFQANVINGGVSGITFGGR